MYANIAAFKNEKHNIHWYNYCFEMFFLIDFITKFTVDFCEKNKGQN